jgi:hypothetical protein
VSQGGDPTWERERAIYEENGRVAATFWEWRHKTMSHFLGVLAGLLALATWAATNDQRGFVVTAFTIGSLFAFASFLMNRRTRQILDWCYAISASIEFEWRGHPRSEVVRSDGEPVTPHAGPYSALSAERAPPLRPPAPGKTSRLAVEMTYYRTLNWLYLAVAISMPFVGVALEVLAV